MSNKNEYLIAIILINLAVVHTNQGFLLERTHVPFLVSVESKEEFKSAGTILSYHWVLSVATRLYDVTEAQLVVRISSTPLWRGALYRVSDLVIHPLYKHGLLSNNIALIKVYTRLPFSYTVHPITLWPNTPWTGDGLWWQLGWNCLALQKGISTHRGRVVSRYQRLFVETAHNLWPEGCSGYSSGRDVLCVQTAPTNHGRQCKEDLGYVLVVNNMLAGLGLTTVNDTVSVYTDISHHVDWIKRIAFNMY